MNLSLPRRARVSHRRRTAVLAGVLVFTVLMGVTAGSALASPPMASEFAGDGTSGPAVPGPALSTPLNDLEGVAVDAAGNLYIRDNDGGHVDKITPDGTLSVIAGSGVGGPPVAGPAMDSPLGRIYSLTADAAGNVFITDWSYLVIMKITPDGILSIVAGESPVALQRMAFRHLEHMNLGAATREGAWELIDSYAGERLREEDIELRTFPALSFRTPHASS